MLTSTNIVIIRSCYLIVQKPPLLSTFTPTCYTTHAPTRNQLHLSPDHLRKKSRSIYTIFQHFKPRKQPRKTRPTMADASEGFRLVCPGMDHEGRLPRKYTDEGQGAKKNLSPPLEWYNLPAGTKTLALVVEDIDAPDPSGPIVPWTCWVMANIPVTLKGLPEGFSGKEEEAGGEYGGIKEGNNDMKVPGWRGPKFPTPGHRLEFRLYALDDELHLGHKVTKDRLLEAIDGHVLGVAVLMAKV